MAKRHDYFALPAIGGDRCVVWDEARGEWIVLHTELGSSMADEDPFTPEAAMRIKDAYRLDSVDISELHKMPPALLMQLSMPSAA